MAGPRTLAVDIGGTGVKLALLDPKGRMIGKSIRVPTPMPPVAPEMLTATIEAAVVPLGSFDRVSVGFPGDPENSEPDIAAYIRDNRLENAVRLLGYQADVPELLSMMGAVVLVTLVGWGLNWLAGATPPSNTLLLYTNRALAIANRLARLVVQVLSRATT